MLLEADFDLTTQYYRLRGQHIYYQHVLDNYHRYGELAPVLAQFSSLCDSFVHDLGNGLNAIRSRLERLSVEHTIPEQAQAIEKAKAICDSCGWRLHTLQEVSPSMPIYPEPLNLPEFIPSLLERLEVWQPPSIQTKFQTTVSRLIVADYAFLLRLALVEPVLNVWQAMPNGGQIIVAVQKLDNGLAQIEIADNGPGLPDDPEQCFDLHFTTGPQRYGLGLYVARKIIEKHRGSFKLLSEMGQGTRIIMQLPVGNPEPEWDDESELVQALEKLHDSVAEQKREIETYNSTYDLPREDRLAQLADLFGQLSVSVVQFLTTGLADMRHLLAPLSSPVVSEIAGDIQFILEKQNYCDLLLGNVRALDPALTIQPSVVDLNQVVSKVVRLMAWRVQPGTELKLNEDTSLPPVHADASLIATALLNLLRNAIDAAGKDGRVEIETLSTGESALIRLTNTGQTIPVDEQTRVFDLDYTTRRKRGFGLGLYVAQAIITRHIGSSITIQDTEQTQTRLEFDLSRYKSAE